MPFGFLSGQQRDGVHGVRGWDVCQCDGEVCLCRLRRRYVRDRDWHDSVHELPRQLLVSGRGRQVHGEPGLLQSGRQRESEGVLHVQPWGSPSRHLWPNRRPHCLLVLAHGPGVGSVWGELAQCVFDWFQQSVLHAAVLDAAECHVCLFLVLDLPVDLAELEQGLGFWEWG